jgi:hypothetical protein
MKTIRRASPGMGPRTWSPAGAKTEASSPDDLGIGSTGAMSWKDRGHGLLLAQREHAR